MFEFLNFPPLPKAVSPFSFFSARSASSSSTADSSSGARGEIRKDSSAKIHFKITATDTTVAIDDDAAREQFFVDVSRGGYVISTIAADGRESIIIDEDGIRGAQFTNNSTTKTHDQAASPGIDTEDDAIITPEAKQQFFEAFNILPDNAKNIVFSLSQKGLANKILIELVEMFQNSGISISRNKDLNARNIKTIRYNEKEKTITFIEVYISDSICHEKNIEDLIKIDGLFKSKYTFNVDDLSQSTISIHIIFPLPLLTQAKTWIASLPTDNLTPLQSEFFNEVTYQESCAIRCMR